LIETILLLKKAAFAVTSNLNSPRVFWYVKLASIPLFSTLPEFTILPNGVPETPGS
jgi:hypothetical protein